MTSQITKALRARLVILGGALCLSLAVGATAAEAALLPHREESSASSNVVSRSIDPEFLIVNESGFNAMVTGLFALPGTSAPTAAEGLRGRALSSMAGCAAAVAAIDWKLPGSWFKVTKSLRRAWAGQSVAKDFSFRKVVGMQMIKGSLSENVLDKVGVHVCTEFRMWYNLIVNAARSLAFNGQTHVVLRVVGSEFTGLSLWSCKVEPRWGPDIDDLNVGGTWFLDNWAGPDAGLIDDACPTPDDWNIPVKTYARLWQPAPF